LEDLISGGRENYTEKNDYSRFGMRHHVKLIRYLVFHEVNHLRFWRHDRLFWQNLEKFFKDPGEFENLLTLYWFRISRF